MKGIGILVLVLIIGISACNDQDKKQSETVKKAKVELSKLEFSNLSGMPVSMDQYKGKTVFINFWATWCRPCLEEMPSIRAVMDKLEKENIVFLFVSDETTEQIENFEARNNYKFEYLRIENMLELNIIGLPTTMIFNKAGVQVFTEMGFRKWDSKESIDLLLEINKEK